MGGVCHFVTQGMPSGWLADTLRCADRMTRRHYRAAGVDPKPLSNLPTSEQLSSPFCAFCSRQTPSQSLQKLIAKDLTRLFERR